MHIYYPLIQRIICCFSGIFICFGLSGYSPETKPKNESPGNERMNHQEKIMYVVDVTKTYQTIQNFGASDCWTAQFFGHFPDDKRNRMADWLFSMETDEQGQPKGIGLSLWRFNIGAGSLEQGELSRIPNATRRGECFQLPDGTYDWKKQSGQRWFLAAARKRGVGQFLAFNLSAPVYITHNGLANNWSRPKDGTFNLPKDKYVEFADFLATVVAELEKRDTIPFLYLSPFNEPEWDWDGNTSQEGTPALLSEMAEITRLLDKKLTEKQLKTEILLTESGQIDYLFRKNTDKPGRDNQIETFFNPVSPHYVGNLSHVPRRMAGHSYWSVTPVDSLYAKRKALRKKLDEYGLNYWQTELCIMGTDTAIGGGREKDLTMKTALYIARIIHYDLCTANASAWHWWLGMTNSNYKDGLVYVTPNSDLTDGEIFDSKLMWTLGNFSRFVRPGAVRVDVSPSQTNPKDDSELMLSAFWHPKDKQLTIVIINTAEREQTVKINLSGVKIKKWQSYVTSDRQGDNLRPVETGTVNDPVRLPARSVTTLTGNRK